MSEASLPLVDVQGKNVGSFSAPSSLFEAQPSEAVVHFVCDAQRFRFYKKTATTKGRSEVSGGGRKARQQKGSGRSRQGGNRAPHWVGGGVAFGPKNEKRNVKVNKKQRRIAFASVLSDRHSSGQVHVLQSNLTEPKTKQFADFLKNMKLENARVAFILKDEVFVAKSVRNLERVEFLTEERWTPFDFLKMDSLVFSEGAAQEIVERWKKSEEGVQA